MPAAIAFAVLSALTNACSAVLQRLAAVQSGTEAKSLWKKALSLVRQPMWLLGSLFLIGTFAFSAVALYFGPLSVVQPVLVLELIFTLGLRVVVLRDRIAPRTWFAALMICVGLAAFLVAASPTEGSHVPTAAQWLVAVSTRGVAVLVLFQVSRSGSPVRRATFLGAATAIVWSVDAAFVKAAVDTLAHGGLVGLLAHWPLYAMISSGVIGTTMLQGAFSVGPLAASQATMLILDPLASIALGIELFHEQLNSGPGAVSGAVLSLAVLGAGVVTLSIWAPPVMTADEAKRLGKRAATGGVAEPRVSPEVPEKGVEPA